MDRRCWLELTIWTSDNSEIERMYIVTPTVTAWPGHDVMWKDVIIIGCCLAFFSLHVKTGNCKSGDNLKMILLTSWKFSWLMILTFVRVMIEWQICCSMMNDEIDTLLWDSLQKCNSYWFRSPQPCSLCAIIKFLIVGLHSFHRCYYVLNLNSNIGWPSL